MAKNIDMEREARIADGNATESSVTFGRESELLVMAVGMGMPTYDWNPDDEDSAEYKFLTGGLEQIMALAFGDAVSIDRQEACEADYGIWFCYCDYEGLKCRIEVTHHDGELPDVVVQALVLDDDGDAVYWSSGHTFKTPAELAEKVKDAVKEALEEKAKGEMKNIPVSETEHEISDLKYKFWDDLYADRPERNESGMAYFKSIFPDGEVTGDYMTSDKGELCLMGVFITFGKNKAYVFFDSVWTGANAFVFHEKPKDNAWESKEPFVEFTEEDDTRAIIEGFVKASGKGGKYNPNTPQGKIFKQLGEINHGKNPTKKDLNSIKQAATDFATGYLPDGSGVDSIEEPDTGNYDTRIRILFSYKGYDYDLHFIAYKDGDTAVNLWNFNDHGEHLACVNVGKYERIADAIERLGHDSPSKPQEVSTIDSRVEQLEAVVSRLDSDMKAVKKQITALKKHK